MRDNCDDRTQEGKGGQIEAEEVLHVDPQRIFSHKQRKPLARVVKRNLRRPLHNQRLKNALCKASEKLVTHAVGTDAQPGCLSVLVWVSSLSVCEHFPYIYQAGARFNSG